MSAIFFLQNFSTHKWRNKQEKLFVFFFPLNKFDINIWDYICKLDLQSCVYLERVLHMGVLKYNDMYVNSKVGTRVHSCSNTLGGSNLHICNQKAEKNKLKII